MNNFERIKNMDIDEMAEFLKKFRNHKTAKDFLMSEYKEYKQLCYDLYKSYDCGVSEHPQTQMDKLGYKVIGAVAQSLYDCWWFTVEDYIEPLPPYLTKMQYDFLYWHGDGRKVVC